MRFDTQFTIRIKDAYAARHEPEAARVLGECLWTCLMAFLALSIVGGIAFGTYEFLRPLAVESEGSAAAARRTMSKSELVKILEAFDARATEYQSRRAAPIPIKDPS